MTGTLASAADWIGAGFKEAAAMVWMTFWPLVLGFSLSGAVQSLLARDGLRASLGTTNARSLTRASLLGMISSSCSYAASAMSRALFARGASWTNSLVFMVASTNLVIELGLVLYFLLGWPFLVAQLVGGALMIAALGVAAGLAFGPRHVDSLRVRVAGDVPAQRATTASWRERVRSTGSYERAARYAWGDLTMLRKELLAGFVVAGFLTVHVSATVWSHLFVSGHGTLTVLENVAIAPLLAVVSFVCSVGNIPLAAALWVHGVAFGGVISFIFADLVTLPLLLIYRRFYGGRVAMRLFVLLWLVMSAGGLVVNGLFSWFHAIPTARRSPAMAGQFPLGATLVLNVLALGVLACVAWLARRPGDARSARDPVCGMEVAIDAPAATRERGGVTYYFCSPRCAERFDDGAVGGGDEAVHWPTSLDPICGMDVAIDAPAATRERGGVTYYFCSPGCAQRFDAGATAPAGDGDPGQVTA